jgi:hypothetical protein
MLKQLHKTKWAKDFKKEDPSIYEVAIKFASDPTITFDIYKSNETGEKIWAIDHKGFWMNAYKTQKQAIQLCKTMGWKYKLIKSGN